MQKRGEDSQETSVWQYSRVLAPPQGMCRAIWYTSLSSSVGTKVPTQEEDGNFRLCSSTWIPDWLEPKGWWVRFLKHCPVTSPPTNQKTVPHLHPSLQISPIKTLPSKPCESLSLCSMNCLFCLPDPAVSLCLLQTPTFWFVWPHRALDTGIWVW